MVCLDFVDFFDTLGECHTARGDGDNEGGRGARDTSPFFFSLPPPFSLLNARAGGKRGKGLCAIGGGKIREGMWMDGSS